LQERLEVLGQHQHIRARLRLFATGANDQIDQIGFLRDLPHVGRLLEQLVGGFYISVQRAHQFLRFFIGGLALARHAFGEDVGGIILAVRGRARKQLAHVRVDAEHNGNGIQCDSHSGNPGVDRHHERGKNVARNPLWQASLSRGLMKTGIGVALMAAAQFAACNGWPRTIPYQQAEHKPENYPTYAPASAQAAEMFYAGNHRYMVMPGEVNLRTARTAGVQTSAQVSVFALEWDAAPYTALFVRAAEGRLRAVAPID
jgi:hypothetical protein